MRGVDRLSIAIKINAGDDEPFAVEIEGFPTTVEVVKSGAGWMVVPFGLFLFSVPFLIFGPVVAAFSGIFLLAALVFVIRRQGRPDIMLFDRHGVVVTETGLLTDSTWKAAYEEFSGVNLRKCRARAGRRFATYQVIELIHPNPAKNLPLFVRKTTRKPKNRWQAYARLLGVAPTGGEMD